MVSKQIHTSPNQVAIKASVVQSDTTSVRPIQSDSIESFVGRKYKVVYADPPWHFKTRSKAGQKRSPSSKYCTMSLDEIAALPISSIADNAPLIGRAERIMNSWGFELVSTGFNWVKMTKSLPQRPKLGCGYYTRKQSELCLLGRRGKPKRPNSKGVGEVILAPPREHSRKPDEVYDRIERMYDGPKVELFARGVRPGWDCFGDELSKFSNLGA